MGSPVKAAIQAAAAKILGVPADHPLRRDPAGDPDEVKAWLAELCRTLVLDPVVLDAVVARSFDGSPERQNLNLRIYVEPGFDGDLARVVERALTLAWAFDAIPAAAYSLQLWRGPRQSPPYDNSAKIDVAPIAADPSLPRVHVHKKFLTVTSKAMFDRFGPRPTSDEGTR